MKILAALLLVPSLAFTQSVYKCPDSEGRFILQQKPCVGGEGKEIAVKPLENGKGSDQSSLIKYSQQLEEDRNRVAIEKDIAIKKQNEQKAIDETIKKNGIVNGKSDNDRYCSGSGLHTGFCQDYWNK